jgi:hypothetical protein
MAKDRRYVLVDVTESALGQSALLTLSITNGGLSNGTVKLPGHQPVSDYAVSSVSSFLALSSRCDPQVSGAAFGEQATLLEQLTFIRSRDLCIGES